MLSKEYETGNLYLPMHIRGGERKKEVVSHAAILMGDFRVLQAVKELQSLY